MLAHESLTHGPWKRQAPCHELERSLCHVACPSPGGREQHRGRGHLPSPQGCFPPPRARRVEHAQRQRRHEGPAQDADGGRKNGVPCRQRRLEECGRLGCVLVPTHVGGLAREHSDGGKVSEVRALALETIAVEIASRAALGGPGPGVLVVEGTLGAVGVCSVHGHVDHHGVPRGRGDLHLSLRRAHSHGDDALRRLSPRLVQIGAVVGHHVDHHVEVIVALCDERIQNFQGHAHASARGLASGHALLGVDDLDVHFACALVH
mmetsp:Transcript_16507/g.50716  ORF Transcript_16507/g.50716 Transcript_16507/m.50716 type:complete len:263 (-) Transcript_16507:311-1099(-)